MKKVIAAVVVFGFAASVYASCPIGTKYKCYPTPSGKMACGCY